MTTRLSAAIAWTAVVLITGLVTVSGQNGQRQAAPPPSPPSRSAIVSPLERLTVTSDGHPMAVWARRPANPHGAILLVHGLTWSTRPDFDLQVPGLQRSVMISLSSLGFATYGVDLRGYGDTKRDATGWLTPRRAASDVINVLSWVASQHPSLPKPALVGWSRGAAISQMVAQMAPGRLSALVLFGFAYDPDAQFVDSLVPEKPQMDKNTPESAASDFVSPKVTSQAVVQAFVDQALKADPIRIDLKNDGEFNMLKPDKVTVPTLVMYGQQDTISDEDAGKFFARLGTGDRQLVVLPGADHAAHLEDTHEAWIAAVSGFLNRPAAHR
jgi:pimeloyl-ACP methyl ester carboxylesterase